MYKYHNNMYKQSECCWVIDEAIINFVHVLYSYKVIIAKYAYTVSVIHKRPEALGGT